MAKTLSPAARRVLVALAVAAVFAAEGKLATVIIPAPVNLAQQKIAPARLALDELVLSGVSIGPAQTELFSSSVLDNESVSLRFDKARLAPETLQSLRALGLKPPADADALDYLDDSDDKPHGGPACQTFFHVTGRCKRLHFFQSGTPGENRQRALDMEADGAELAVALNTVSPHSDKPDAPGCRKLLQIGASWHQALGDSIPLKILVSPGSAIHFRFFPATGRAAPWLTGADSSFEPLVFGGARLQVESLALVPLGTDGLPNSRAEPQTNFRRVEAKKLLSVSGLHVGAQTLQAAGGGMAYATIDTQMQGTNALEWLSKNPLFALLFGGANAGLLAWAKAAFTGKKSLDSDEKASDTGAVAEKPTNAE